MPVFLPEVVRNIWLIAMTLVLSGCGSIISRTVPGQDRQPILPRCTVDVRDSLALSSFSICHSRCYLIRCCYRWASHGPYDINARPLISTVCPSSIGEIKQTRLLSFV